MRRGSVCQHISHSTTTLKSINCSLLPLHRCVPFHTVIQTGDPADGGKIWYLGIERGRTICMKEFQDGGVWRRGPDGMIFLKGGPLIRSGCAPECIPTEKMSTFVHPR